MPNTVKLNSNHNTVNKRQQFLIQAQAISVKSEYPQDGAECIVAKIKILSSKLKNYVMHYNLHIIRYAKSDAYIVHAEPFYLYDSTSRKMADGLI